MDSEFIGGSDITIVTPVNTNITFQYNNDPMITVTPEGEVTIAENVTEDGIRDHFKGDAYQGLALALFRAYSPNSVFHNA